MVSEGAIHDFVMSHHPKNTAGAVHPAGLAGNNLGNSHLQVSGGWQHGPGARGETRKSTAPKFLSCMLCLGTGPAGKGRASSMPRSRFGGPCFAVFLLEGR